MFKRVMCLLLLGVGLTFSQVNPASGAFNVNSDPSLISWYRLDETSGTTAVDSSASGHDGTLNGGTEWVAGQLGGALQFNGSNTYVDCGPEAGSGVTDAVTLTAWINCTSFADWRGIITKGQEAAPFAMQIWGDGALRFAANWGTVPESVGGGEWNTTTPLTIDQWTHAAVTYGEGTITFYIDGAIVDEVAVDLQFGQLDESLTLGCDFPGGDEYFDGAIDDARIYNIALTEADIQTIMLGGNDEIAGNPSPADEAVDVPLDVALGWKAGEFAATHDVYFGTSFDDVNAADRTDPMGVLLSQGQTGAMYQPEDALEYNTTYYWRVDEVNAAPDNTIFKGDLWSFTTEPYAYAITSIEATTNGVSDAGAEPSNAVDGTGLNGNDQHSTDVADMWLATPPADEPLWLQCAFDKVYKLHQLQVWNHNTAFETFLGFGVKDVTIEYSVDGAEWTVLGDYVFEGAPGTTTYTANTTVDMEGIAAQYVRLVVNSTQLSAGKTGLSEIRFSYLPVEAREPEPADGATDVDVATALAWRAGREAVEHDVYLDAIDGTTLVATTQTAGYEPGTLDLATTYYWRVAEVNTAEAVSVWEGPLWSFATQEYLVVDDFETYIDDDAAGDTIWEFWIDGLVEYGGDAANGGSQVGHIQTPFAEQEIVYSGDQSMPLYYDNTSSPYYSQAKRTFSTPQNWAEAGITTLVVYFRGDFDNAQDPIYAEINGTRVDYDGGTEIVGLPIWKQWNIDLTGLGNLQSVSTLAIGVGGGSPGGTGILYVDAIRLYREAPESPAPVDPGTDGLAAYYKFDGTLADTSGNGNAAVAMDNEIYEESVVDGQAVSLDGINDYLELPIGSTVASADSMTVASWYYMRPNTNSWQRLFDFGTSGTEGYMFFSPQMNQGGGVRFAIEAPGSGTESLVEINTAPLDAWHHVAVVIDSTDMSLTLYLDGAVVATGTTETLPSDLGQTTQNWLGRSQYEADGYYNGLIDEFRIYNRALSAGEVRYLTGER